MGKAGVVWPITIPSGSRIIQSWLVQHARQSQRVAIRLESSVGSLSHIPRDPSNRFWLCIYMPSVQPCPLSMHRILLLRSTWNNTRSTTYRDHSTRTTKLSTSSTLLIRVIWGFALQPPAWFAQSALAAVCSSLPSWSEPVWFAIKSGLYFLWFFRVFHRLWRGGLTGVEWLSSFCATSYYSFYFLLCFCFLRLAVLSKTERIEPMMATPSASYSGSSGLVWIEQVDTLNTTP